jgi:hypothetical protein
LLLAVPALLLAAVGTTHPTGLSQATAHHWWSMHVYLVPVFPLTALALGVLVRGDGSPVAWLARVAGYGYATFYTALDVLSGIGAGLVAEDGGDTRPLFRVGDGLGLVGSWCFLAAGTLVTVALARRAGPWVLPGGVLVLAGGWLFLENHIFMPYGVLGQLLIAGGTALLAVAGPARVRVPTGAHARPAPSG